jgi:hypothetical protein
VAGDSNWKNCLKRLADVTVAYAAHAVRSLLKVGVLVWEKGRNIITGPI